jgi:hypothetical protein
MDSSQKGGLGGRALQFEQSDGAQPGSPAGGGESSLLFRDYAAKREAQFRHDDRKRKSLYPMGSHSDTLCEL